MNPYAVTVVQRLVFSHFEILRPSQSCPGRPIPGFSNSFPFLGRLCHQHEIPDSYCCFYRDRQWTVTVGAPRRMQVNEAMTVTTARTLQEATTIIQEFTPLTTGITGFKNQAESLTW